MQKLKTACGDIESPQYSQCRSRLHLLEARSMRHGVSVEFKGTKEIDEHHCKQDFGS